MTSSPNLSSLQFQIVFLAYATCWWLLVGNSAHYVFSFWNPGLRNKLCTGHAVLVVEGEEQEAGRGTQWFLEFLLWNDCYFHSLSIDLNKFVANQTLWQSNIFLLSEDLDIHSANLIEKGVSCWAQQCNLAQHILFINMATPRRQVSKMHTPSHSFLLCYNTPLHLLFYLKWTAKFILPWFL